ncbi:MAG: purine-nucleoside phosphorylase [Chloroflexi bacterium RBG_16_63_12]|nr:MAG: purine-nucleoside phosphorylase [Chloroflexi bacterium RBG_16_63_12]
MTDEYFTRAQFEEAAAAIRAKTRHTPRIGIILGSGLGPLADAVQDADILLPSENVPYWPRSTVEGHIGRLVIGKLEGQMVLVQQGRAHSYEGHSMQRVTLPVRVMQRLGLETLIVTNAAGAINPAFRPGDVMLITDHINLMGMAGVSPLRGPNDDSLGVRFPDMSRAYDRELRALALEAAEEAGLRLHQGVYICLGGPSFETPADLRFLRLIGADAVGMSTVPEVTVARHGGLRVLGLSGISNAANLDGDTLTTHEEVLAAGREIVPKLTSIVRGVLRRLPAN